MPRGLSMPTFDRQSTHFRSLADHPLANSDRAHVQIGSEEFSFPQRGRGRPSPPTASPGCRASQPRPRPRPRIPDSASLPGLSLRAPADPLAELGARRHQVSEQSINRWRDQLLEAGRAGPLKLVEGNPGQVLPRTAALCSVTACRDRCAGLAMPRMQSPALQPGVHLLDRPWQPELPATKSDRPELDASKSRVSLSP